MLPKDELRKLFELRKCTSDTHDSLDCTRCPKKIAEPDSDNPDQVPAGAPPPFPALPCACVASLHLPPFFVVGCRTVNLYMMFRRWRALQTSCSAAGWLQSTAPRRGPDSLRNRHGGPFLSSILSFSFPTFLASCAHLAEASADALY